VKKKDQTKQPKDYEAIAFTWTKSKIGKYKLLKRINKKAYKKSLDIKK
tara:strand:+ start:624 stop:767 length:144 start_codon:yes stop_codon:yes gene_type:complete